MYEDDDETFAIWHDEVREVMLPAPCVHDSIFVIFK